MYECRELQKKYPHGRREGRVKKKLELYSLFHTYILLDSFIKINDSSSQKHQKQANQEGGDRNTEKKCFKSCPGENESRHTREVQKEEDEEEEENECTDQEK